ncbi:MAG: hypothetical protein WCS73_03365 [Lentisphaeria bacterium]
METSIEHELCEAQLSRLKQAHYLILLWSAKSESQGYKYNITNCFDDLKHAGITRTKQTAVAVIESVASLCFIEIRDERNRKNIYITKYGAKALANIATSNRFELISSAYLEEQIK